ncbi:MAG: contractile injection system tape measure protein [Cyanobacteriota bacterium]
MNFAEGGDGDDSPAPPSHRLHRLELEISSAEEPLARSLMDRLSQLHHGALEALLERVFSELSPPGRWDRLERLELDLGTLQASDLEQQLPQQLEAALRRALAARLPPLQPPAAPNRPQPPSATDPPETSTAAAGPAADAYGFQRQLELLALFTATGSLPWWAPRHDRQLIAVALDSALALPPPELRALLQQLAGAPGEPSVALQRLLAAASPRQRPRIERALHEAALQGKALQGEATMKAAQEEALQADLVAVMNPKAPVVPPTKADTTPTTSDSNPTTTAPPEAPGEPDPNPPNPSALAHLALYASTGRWPPGEGLGPNPPQALEAALDTALALPPSELRALLQQLAGVPGEPSVALQLLLAAASPQQRLQLEQSIKAAHDGALEAALQEVELQEVAVRRSAPPALTPPPALQLPKATPLPAQQPPRQHPLFESNEPAAANAPAPPLPSQPTTPPTPQPRSDVDDDLVIDGAGMVLFWPFLETLFSRLELLTQERLFGDEAQRQRAMALLGFLVDGDGDPPEWRLTLAKLLCGALPQAPYGLDAPLSDAERGEAEALLQAVLDHADGRLGDDGTSLRQEFLQRPGLLSARPGAWVLQVERRSGDEVLDGLPWSWSWIRLPWMDDLLQVVW